jgi:hypothetical protein
MKLTICGSIAFYTHMEDLKQKLEQKGHEVLIPLLAEEATEFGGGRTIQFGTYIEEHGGIGAFPAGHKIWDLKEAAIWDHYHKVDWADAILVVNDEKRNIEGYIGGNTLMEMGVAFYTKKPIYVLNAPSSALSYIDEILGMKPIVLDGDLDKIPL